MDSKIKIGILEDDEDMRAYLSMLIRQSDDMEIVYSCGTLKEALDAASNHHADLCLVDLQLPDGNGVDFTRAVKENSNTKVLILTVLGDKTSVIVSFEAGANGYLLKDTEPNQIRRDIRAVIKGGIPISPQASIHILSMFKAQNVPANSGAADRTLSKREREVLSMFSRGLSYKETARKMDISPYTVSGYVKSIYKKLSVHSRSEAIFEAIQKAGLIFNPAFRAV